MVYRKKRVSRIKSKRSGSKSSGSKSSGSKSSGSKSLKIRRIKRTRAKRSRRRIKGGASDTDFYTDILNSSPILDEIIKTKDDIKKILEFIHDINTIPKPTDGYYEYAPGYSFSQNILENINLKHKTIADETDETYEPIYKLFVNTLKKYSEKYGDGVYYTFKRTQEHILQTYTGSFYIQEFKWNPILKLLQLELFAYLSKNSHIFGQLSLDEIYYPTLITFDSIDAKIIDTTNIKKDEIKPKPSITYGKILKSIKLQDIIDYCKTFEIFNNPPNTSCDNITIQPITSDSNLLDLLIM